MKQIRTFKSLLRNLRNAQHFQFHYWIVEVLGEEINTREGLKPIYDAYKALFDQEDEIQKHSRTQEGTEQLKELDFQRDRVLSVLNSMVNAAARDVTSDALASAVAVQKLLRVYKDSASKDYVSNTSELINLVQDLRLPANATHIEALKLTDMVDRLEATNLEFDEVYNQRMDWVGDQEALGKMAEIRPQVDEAFGVLAEAIESLYKANELIGKDPAVEASLGHLVDQINNRLNQLARVTNSRTSSSSGNGGNGGGGNGGGEEPEDPDAGMPRFEMQEAVIKSGAMLIEAVNKQAFSEFIEEHYQGEGDKKGIEIVEQLGGGLMSNYYYTLKALEMELDEDFVPVWTGLNLNPRNGYGFHQPFTEDVLKNPYTVYLRAWNGLRLAVLDGVKKPREIKFN